MFAPLPARIRKAVCCALLVALHGGAAFDSELRAEARPTQNAVSHSGWEV
jgi:hypothetical protein